MTKDGKLEIVYNRPNGYTPLLDLKEYADFYKLDIVNRLLEMNVLEKTNTYLAMQNILLKDTRERISFLLNYRTRKQTSEKFAEIKA